MYGKENSMKTILTVREDYALQLNPKAITELKRIAQPGIEVEAILSTEKARSLPQHRRYFARLGEFAENIPETTSRVFWISILKDLFKVEQIDAEVVHELVKKITGINSVAFHKLTQDEANGFYRQADELLDRWSAAMEANAV